MRYALTLALVTFFLQSSAQTVDNESFVNEIYTSFVDSTFPHYKLSGEAFKISGNALDALWHRVPDSSAKEMLKNYYADTIDKTWDQKKLVIAELVNKDSIGIITGAAITTYSLNSWSKKRKERERQKQLTQLYLKREKMPEYNKRVYFFSRPVFDNKKEYAVIHLGYSCGFTCGTGCDYIFKLTNGKWKLIGMGQCISA